MRNPARETLTALKTVLTPKRSRLRFVIVTIVAFIAFLYIPVLLIPGNDIRFYLTILRPTDYAIYAALAATIAAIVGMQVFLFQQSRGSRNRFASATQGGAGASSAVLGGLLATAACSSCIAGLLGFLGVGTVLFVAQNNVAIAVAVLFISFFSLYMSSRKVNGHCKSCETVCK